MEQFVFITPLVEKQLVAAFKACEWEKAKQVIELTRDCQLATQAEAEARKRREEADRQLSNLTGNGDCPKDFNGRKIRLKVTYGSLAHRYLLVTRALDDGLLRGSEKLKVHVPATGDSFETEVYFPNKHLTERRKIRRFYKATGVQRGDFVLLEEMARVAAHEGSLRD